MLVLLAALTATSAAWTIGSPADALRWGAVGAGYAAMAVCGFAATTRLGAESLATLLVVLAMVTGLLGVFAAGFQDQPLAERIGGSWRPGGPFEYAPALGALCLAALPLALRWMVATGRRAAAGAGAVAILAAAIALISSRAVLALGLLLALAVLLRPRATVRCGPALATAAIVFAVTVGAGADAVAGSYDEPYSKSADGLRILGLSLLFPAAVMLWLAIRRCFDAAGGPIRPRRGAVVALTVLPLVAACVAAALTPDSGTGVEPDSGLSHGRTEIWADAIETARDGPIEGSGALTFLPASTFNQQPPRALFAHNLVLEAWVELGYAGLLLTLAFALIAILLMYRSRGAPAGWLLAPGAGAYLVAAMIDWPWHVPASAAIFALILGGLAASQPAPRPDPAP